MPRPCYLDIRALSSVSSTHPYSIDSSLRAYLSRFLMPRLRSQTGSSGIVEFVLSLGALVLVVFFLIDLIALVTGYAILHLASRQASFKAATADNLPVALAEMQSITSQIAQSGFGKFARLRPIGGFNNSGTELFINVTSVSTGATTQIGPNSGIPRPVDSDVNVYECAARLNFEVGPLVSFGGVPLLKDIPGCGKPAPVSVVTNIALEHPERLAVGGNGNNNGSTQQPPGSNITPGSGPANTGYLGGWNYPIVGYFVLMPGQVIEQQKDLIIPAAGPSPYAPNDDDNWVDTQIDVRVDNRISIAWNFFAMGRWSHAGSLTYGWYDADGTPSGSGAFGLPSGVLVGRIGRTGQLFRIGKDFYNYSPVDTGRLYMRMNDGANGLYDNIGEQKVTVFLTN